MEIRLTIYPLTEIYILDMYFFVMFWYVFGCLLLDIICIHTCMHTYIYNIPVYVTVYRKTRHPSKKIFFCTYRVVGVQILSSPSFIVVA